MLGSLAVCGSAVLVSSSDIGLQLMFSGEWKHLLAFLVASGFIPALALVLGIWTSTSNSFEIVYLLWWYEIVNGVAPLDFMSNTESALAHNRKLFFLGILIIPLLLAAAGRYRQLNCGSICMIGSQSPGTLPTKVPMDEEFIG